jgi:DNA invertase Pin-like site-specific DNA recombinase
MSTKQLRAVGYSRTSGEGQRDNGWKFIRHYVDESKTGSTIAGRSDFQRMMKDAANDEFNYIVPFDVSRFARDGVDILSTAKFLKQTFGICVVDTKGHFDNRHGNILLNFVHAGVSEFERDSIKRRTGKGRIDQAKDGSPWSGHRPYGRDCPKDTVDWSLNDDARKMRALLEEYAAGREGMTALAKKYGFSSANRVFNIIRSRDSQLECGWPNDQPYVAALPNPETGIVEDIPVPQIPAVILQDLFQDVQDRMAHQRRHKQNHRQYVLTGFVNCGHCNRALTGNAGKYYRHCANPNKKPCVFGGIPSNAIVAPVLDYLYSFFTDEPAFKAAVSAAVPSEDERAALEAERDQTQRSLAKVDRGISNIGDAVAEGAALLKDKLDQLGAEKQRLTDLLTDINARIAAMPERKVLLREAMLIREDLLLKCHKRDWRKLPVDDIHRFLVFLFGENPGKNGNGIRVMQEEGRWKISFKGNLLFGHDIVDGRPHDLPARKFVTYFNKWLKPLAVQKKRVEVTRRT